MYANKSYKVPSNGSQTATVARFEIRKHMRSKGIVGMLAVIVMIVALMTALPPLLGNDYATDPMDFVTDYVSWVELLVLVGAVAFASGSLVSEFERRTGLLMFPQPVNRTSYLLGKFISTIALMAAMLCVYYGLVAVVSLAITGGVPALMLNSLGFAILYAAGMCGTVYLFSSILKSGTGAIILTVLVFLMVMPMMGGMLSMAEVDPWFLLSQAGDAIGYSLQDPYPVTTTATMGRMTATSYVISEADAAFVMLGYAVLPLIASVFAFKRREL